MDLLLKQMPSLAQKSYNKRQQVMNSFEEVEYKAETILELEGMHTNFIYLIVKGEVKLMRKPENLYDKRTGKMVKVYTQL